MSIGNGNAHATGLQGWKAEYHESKQPQITLMAVHYIIRVFYNIGIHGGGGGDITHSVHSQSLPLAVNLTK